jgi:quinol monooxygenase YgiN
MSLLVVLELQAVEGGGDELIAMLRDTLGDTRARQGCESVTVHRDAGRPDAVVLIERWASREDDAAYRAWRAGDGAVPALGPLLAAAPAIRYFDDVDA